MRLMLDDFFSTQMTRAGGGNHEQSNKQKKYSQTSFNSKLLLGHGLSNVLVLLRQIHLLERSLLTESHMLSLNRGACSSHLSMVEEIHFEKSPDCSAKLILENTPTFIIPSRAINGREVSKGKSPNVLNFIYLFPAITKPILKFIFLNVCPIYPLSTYKRKKKMLCVVF